MLTASGERRVEPSLGEDPIASGLTFYPDPEHKWDGGSRT